MATEITHHFLSIGKSVTEPIELGIPNLEDIFYQNVTDFVQSNQTSYIDAILHWCQIRQLEIECVIPLIQKNLALKARIQGEAEDLNFLKKVSRLPI